MQHGQSRGPRLPLGVCYAAAIACAVGLASLAYATVNHPLTAWRIDIDRRADLVRDKLAEGPALRQRHADRQRELAQLVEHVDAVNHRIPDEPNEGEFLADLSRLAAANGVEIDDFRRAGSQSLGTHSVVTLDVTATGAHSGLCQLVSSVAELPRLAELTRLEVRRGPDNQQHAIALTYSLYYGLATSSAATPSDPQ